MAGEREPCGCWGECSHPACLTGPSGVCCRMNEPPPSPDPAALWALVGRWREEARRDDLTASGVLMSASGALRLEAAAVARRRLASELAALLPPEGT